MAEAVAETAGYIGRIPVRNLWLLIFYAARYFQEAGEAAVDLEKAPDELPELAARLLFQSVEHRLRSGLTVGYLREERECARLRGRLDWRETVCHRLAERGQAACRFEELSVDIPRNRFVRDALEASGERRCRALGERLRLLGVRGPAPSRSELDRIVFNRNDVADRRMIAAAKLVFDLAMPTEQPGPEPLPKPDREIRLVRQLYQRGVEGFFRSRLASRGWLVSGPKKLKWQVAEQTSGISAYLPGMETDITLDHPETGRRIIVDTKFNEILTAGYHRDRTLRNGYLYQIYAYLRTQEKESDPVSLRTSGLLLHPAIGYMMDEAVEIQEHKIRFATVDLSAHADVICEQLLRLIPE